VKRPAVRSLGLVALLQQLEYHDSEGVSVPCSAWVVECTLTCPSVTRPGEWERPLEFGIRAVFPWMVASEGVLGSLCFFTEKTKGGCLLHAAPFGCFLWALWGEWMNNLRFAADVRERRGS